MIDAYGEFWRSYRLYWHLYGGWRAVLTSPYLHISFIITAICAPAWFCLKDGQKVWADAAVNILPNLMGFSIAGMAIFLAFSNRNTIKAVTEDGEADSFFVSTVANFFHFIILQTIALLLGFIAQHYTTIELAAIGTFFLTYALLVSPAMAMQLLRTSQIINAAESLPEIQNDES